MRDLFWDEELQAIATQCPETTVDSVLTCMSFLQTAFDITRKYDLFFAQYGLSAGKFTLLLLLHKCTDEIVTPAICAQRSGVSRGTMTGLLEGLERDGLIHRQAHPTDKRMAKIQLSDEGRSLLQSVLPQHIAWTGKLMSTLSPSEKQTLATLMDKLQTQSTQLR